MPRVYGVQDSDNKLSGWVSEDDTDTAPTGETAVLESVIRAADPPGEDGRIQSGGHWDGTTYTPPAGDELFIPFNPTTGSGMVKVAAHNMEDVFDEAINNILDNRSAWPQHLVEWAITGIHRQRVNVYRIILNSVRTVAFRQKYCEEAASWPTGVSGDWAKYVDSFDNAMISEAPGEKFSWVTDDADPSTRLDTASAYPVFDTTTNVEAAPSSSELIGRAVINDIPD